MKKLFLSEKSFFILYVIFSPAPAFKADIGQDKPAELVKRQTNPGAKEPQTKRVTKQPARARPDQHDTDKRDESRKFGVPRAP